MTKSESDRSNKVTKRNRKSTGRRLWLLTGVGLVAIGLLFGGYGFIANWLSYRDNHAQALQNTAPVQTSIPLINGVPTHITISSVEIDLKVIPGQYNPSTKSWTLSLDKAQWGVMTAQANNKSGATFIYGHNRRSVFARLVKVQEGDKAVVNTENGHQFTYKFVRSSITSPEDTSLLTYEGKPVLVLQTCTGLWYQDRQLFVFDLVELDGKTTF